MIRGLFKWVINRNYVSINSKHQIQSILRDYYVLFDEPKVSVIPLECFGNQIVKGVRNCFVVRVITSAPFASDREGVQHLGIEQPSRR
jgi:hypothetical protein